MNAQSFLEDFGYLANAPNGVAKFREMILCLAMLGKLSDQRSDDVPADELMEKVAEEKQRQIDDKKSKQSKPSLKIQANEIPHPISKNWAWVRFGDIAQHNAGKTLDQRRNTGDPRDYITTSNLYWGRFELGELRQMLIRDEELDRCTAKKGDLLICEGGEAGRAAVWPHDYEVSFQNHVHRARFYADINPYFAYRFLEKLNATGEINNYRKGVGISNMSGKALASIVFPLPPLEEQKRIVAKVDELMALCDKLEAQQQERERLFPVLSRATHTRFAESPTPENLRHLFHKSYTIQPADLRQSILTLAVQGKLLAKGDGFHGGSKGSSVDPFVVPETWEWHSLDALISIKHGYAFKSEHFTSEPHQLVLTTPGNFYENGGFRDRGSKTKYYAGVAPEDFILGSGDLIIPMTEQAVGLLGSPAFIPGDGKTYLHNQRLGKIQPNTDTVSLNYLACFFKTPYFRQEVGNSASGMKVRHTSPKKILRIPIPLPPLAEQRRIVAKVDQLMALVDQLEQQQSQKSKVAAAYAQSTVIAITGAQTKEVEPMKAPRTELITKLDIGVKPKATDLAPLANLIAKSKDGLSAKALWQQSGLEIAAFYQQLKTEMAKGWIDEPEPAVMKEVEAS
jgi:type I restriction enzyme S subunit